MLPLDNLFSNHLISSNILKFLSFKEQLKLAFTGGSIYIETVLSYFHENDIVSVSKECLKSTLHEYIQKLQELERKRQVEHYLRCCREFERATFRWDHDVSFQTQLELLQTPQWIDAFKAFCENVHLPCPELLYDLYIEGVLEDVLLAVHFGEQNGEVGLSNNIYQIGYLRQHVDMWYPLPQDIC